MSAVGRASATCGTRSHGGRRLLVVASVRPSVPQRCRLLVQSSHVTRRHRLRVPRHRRLLVRLSHGAAHRR
ncbi:Os12g0135400 [Oryza sativa Japonica Group]|uniref:Os12g0135400 protein n=1 Tax=Oryza sativa subsp. japonica TaxID=39947 RepID=A0A0P0Y6P4_ORYSJ|nr:Os12g0135400 [Oryza sativa Japonica Group]